MALCLVISLSLFRILDRQMTRVRQCNFKHFLDALPIYHKFVTDRDDLGLVLRVRYVVKPSATDPHLMMVMCGIVLCSSSLNNYVSVSFT